MKSHFSFPQHTPTGVVKAAVKTLKDGSSPDQKKKFLQEAAIMGQFKHRNVVELYGFVDEGSQVRQNIKNKCGVFLRFPLHRGFA